MKKSIPTLLSSFLFIAASSQSFRFEHTGGRAAFAKRTDLKQARVVQEIIPVRPSAYFNDFMDIVTVDITATCGGKPVKSTGAGDSLTADQKSLLCAADMGTDIIVRLSFRYRETAGDVNPSGSPPREIDFWITPGPETDAEYPGGERQMADYIQYAFVSKADALYNGKKVPWVSVAFTIDETGQVTGAVISRTSADPKIDELALDAIAKMPKWKAAQDAKGSTVKRRFIVSLGAAGC